MTAQRAKLRPNRVLSPTIATPRHAIHIARKDPVNQIPYRVRFAYGLFIPLPFQNGALESGRSGWKTAWIASELSAQSCMHTPLKWGSRSVPSRPRTPGKAYRTAAGTRALLCPRRNGADFALKGRMSALRLVSAHRKNLPSHKAFGDCFSDVTARGISR